MLDISTIVWSGKQTAVFGGFALFALLAVLGDSITTMIGLSSGKGYEANPIMRWLFAKIGQSLSAWISAVLVLFVGAAFASVSLNAGIAYCAIIGVAESIRTYLNYRTLKALKIPL